MKPSRWEAVLFDLDGTLADSIGLILECYRHTMRTHFGRELGDERWLEGLGTPLDRQLAGFASSEVEAIAMRETYIVFQREVHDHMVRPFPGVVDLLADLLRAGCPLGLVTSKRREMTERTMRVCGIEAMFGVVITPERVRNGKPDPEPVLAAVHELNARAEHVLFVGDAPADLVAGRAAGVKTGAALWGPFPRDRLVAHAPDHLLETVGDVRALTLGE
ncbi:MAG: HAD-IA family hydrolase [Gemmatimonadetes bacterium]|nr:HAD-IA family hydrolase [Gemmatimonadota bacterium]